MRRIVHARAGFTLIEVLIFITIFALVVAVMIPMLFNATEARLRQQTIAFVEDNSAQAIQNMERHIRNAERIISPAMGATGSVLVLQYASGGVNPVIFGVQTGSLVLIERDVRWQVTSSQVAVLGFTVRNTSTSSTQQSVQFSFDVSRTIRLQLPHTYRRSYVGAVALHPDDTPQGDACGCPSPSCASNVYTWYICSSQLCYERYDTMECP